MVKKITLIIVILATQTLPVLISAVFADAPPEPGGGPGGGNGPVGGGSPVGSSLAILFCLGIAYGIKKVRNICKL